MKKIIKLALVLFLISAIVAGVLGVVNELTKDRIAQIAAKKTAEAYAEVLNAETYDDAKYEGKRSPSQRIRTEMRSAMLSRLSSPAARAASPLSSVSTTISSAPAFPSPTPARPPVSAQLRPAPATRALRSVRTSSDRARILILQRTAAR